MRAWLLEGLGGLEKLKLGEIADPIAGRGEIVLRVKFAALNPADRYLAEGQYPARPTFPHILGRDGVGEVIALGPGVDGWQTGETALLLRSEVGVSRAGTFAEKVAIPAESLTRVPRGWTDQQAAGAPLVYLTAHQALTTFGQLPPSVVLVTGASGGVGVASIHLGKAMAHTVIALSRGTAKRDALLEQGAAAVFDPTDTGWKKKLREHLGERRVDLTIDNIGGELFNDIIEVLGNHGRVSVVGRLAGPVPQFNTASLLFRRITIRGIVVAAYTPPEAQATWATIVRTLDGAGVRPLVDSTFPFEKLVPDAFERLRQGPLGKVLLEVR
jgi:NADPH2:quinone reductase